MKPKPTKQKQVEQESPEGNLLQIGGVVLQSIDCSMKELTDLAMFILKQDAIKNYLGILEYEKKIKASVGLRDEDGGADYFG